MVQILSPNGLEKFEAGQPVTITWRSDGLALEQKNLLMHTGGDAVGEWLANAYQSVSYSNSSFTSAVDVSGVTNPAPQEVYQSYAYASWGEGNRIAWNLPAADGTYVIRLLFVEPSVGSVDQREFDINLQGVTVESSYDIFAAAGATYKATTLSYTVTASGGNGIDLELVNTTYYGALLSGIELIKSNPSGVAVPTADVELSIDNGMTWTTLANNVAMDRFGQGQYIWTPSSQTDEALIRVRANQGGMPIDLSNQTFLIANGGSDYYINDASTAGDIFTTAVGDNANSGKSPSQPMASLAALLAAYDLDPGDVIHVDAGTYHLVPNIVITSEDSGVRIEGPTTGAAVLDRGNTSSGSYVIELAGADNVTLDRLGLTGAFYGVYAGSTADSDHLTLSNSEIYDNTSANIYLETSNDDATLAGNNVHGASVGMYLAGTDTVATANEVFSHSTGVQITGLRSELVGNEIYNNAVGVLVTNTGSDADKSIVTDNEVHHNSSRGIDATGNVVVTGNEVWDQSATGAIGILLSNNAVARENVVFDNYAGISEYTYSYNVTVENNRVFHNATTGVSVRNVSTVRGNVVYSNSIGIQGDYTSTVLIANNLVYANTNQGIYLNRGAGAQVINNTVYQQVGNAVFVEGSSTGVGLRNNILWVEAGYNIYVASDSQVGFTSDYNLLYRKDATVRTGFWGGDQTSLADWQAATGADENSTAASPELVDINGADDALGWLPIGGGYDGGADDNFLLGASSPAIDRADTWSAPNTDLLGVSRLDDPGTNNQGSGDYKENVLGSSLFAASGVGQNWRSNNTAWNLPLSFAFPFYGQTYADTWVSSEGVLHFGGPNSQHDPGNNTTAGLLANIRIAPFWDSLRTDGSSDDIYVDSSIPDQVTIRWDATSEVNSSDISFSVTLFSDGRVRYDYGSMDPNLSPTIGLSGGDSEHFVLSSYNGLANIDGAASVLFELTPGYADLGAFEFQGSSLDVTPPTIVGVTPSEILEASTISSVASPIVVQFSEPLNVFDANSVANYDLRRPGTNGVFGDADDVIILLSPTYVLGSTSVSLSTGNETLGDGTYRFTISGAESLRDLSALILDGDGDQLAGGAFVRYFTVNSNPLTGDYDRDADVDQQDYIFWKANFGATAGIGLQADGNGDGRVNLADYTVWRDNLGATNGGGGTPIAALEGASLTGDSSRGDSARPAPLALPEPDATSATVMPDLVEAVGQLEHKNLESARSVQAAQTLQHVSLGILPQRELDRKVFNVSNTNGARGQSTESLDVFFAEPTSDPLNAYASKLDDLYEFADDEQMTQNREHREDDLWRGLLDEIQDDEAELVSAASAIDAVFSDEMVWKLPRRCRG